jgi:anti-sigma regulatory factor (Ser/Thr protein kinase)
MKYAQAGQFLARLEQLRPMRAFLEKFCAETSLPRAACLRLNLVLEELFTNTVKHGHHGDCDAPVWVSLSLGDDALQVLYEDKAPAFNPYAYMPEGLPDVTLGLRKIGGLGVLLTKELAASRDYAYLFGRNRIRLTLAPA